MNIYYLIILLYFLYFTGNIIYDMFLKKDYQLAEQTQNITEHTFKGIETDELEEEETEEKPTNITEEKLRKENYRETEKKLEEDRKKKKEDALPKKEQSELNKFQMEAYDIESKDINMKKPYTVKEALKKANTEVSVIDNVNGHNVYNSKTSSNN